MIIAKGMNVVMNDGWVGKVQHDDGKIVVCIAAGSRPNDYLKGYRAINRRRVTVSGTKAVIDWKCTGPVIDRARLSREWESRPYN